MRVYFSEKLVEFFTDYKKQDINKFIEEQTFAIKLCSQVGEIAEKAGLPQFRLTKSSF